MAVLGDKAVGDIVKIKEDGVDVEYIIVHKGKPSDLYDDSCNGVWVLRRRTHSDMTWDGTISIHDGSSSVHYNDYENSSIKKWLNNEFVNLIESEIKASIKTVKIPYRKGSGSSTTVQTGANGLRCKVFLLSYNEVGRYPSSSYPNDGTALNYFSGDSKSTRKASANSGGDSSWWLRTPHSSDSDPYNAWNVESDGSVSYSYTNYGYNAARPAFILPTTLTVNSDGTLTTVTNSPPTISSSTSSGSSLGEVSVPFNFTYTVNDVDNDAVTVSEYLDDVLQRSYSVSLGRTNTFQAVFDADSFQGISNGSHTLKVIATDNAGTSSSTYTVTFNKQVNTAPTISSTTSSGSDLGKKTKPFDFMYTVNDVDDGTVTVKEYLDDVLQREYTVVLGADNTFQAVATNEDFEKITSGSHTIKIIAIDDKDENSAPYTVTFEKKVITPPVVDPPIDKPDNSQVIPDCGSFTGRMKGIDVSHWQGDIDYKQVKDSGIDFVIIKAGEWYHTDEKFEQNYENAKAAGLHIGFYWFCDGKTLDEISMEADACIKALEGKQFDFPIYIDLENSYQYDLGKQFCSDAVRTFCDKLEKAGYFAGLYTATSWLDSVIDDDVKKRFTLWVADWRGYCGYDGDYGVWQYGAGYVPGINGKTESNILEYGIDTDYPGSVVADGVDLDYAYEDFPCIITSKGFNNYPTIEEKWENDDCETIANTLSFKPSDDTETALSGDRWFLVDKSCTFTLETLPYAKIRIYVVGGGCDGAEWEIDPTNPQIEAYRVPLGCRGGSVFIKELTLTGNVECQTFVADANSPTSTAVRIGDDIYKCDDKGSVWRKATVSSNAEPNYMGGVFNSENGANGVKTPYGYVGSSGGGGGAYSAINYQYVTVYAGKGGAGAGNGGELKKDGEDAQNYGCGGGSAGFFGFYSDGNVVETHAGHGRGGCVIFEILDSGECNDSPNNPNKGNSANGCGCACNCNRLEDIFTCPDLASSTETCTKETSYTLTYDGDTPVETETTTNTPSIISDSSQTSSNTETAATTNNSCGCGKSSSNYSSSGCGCCDSGSGNGRNGCVSYDVARWGENWLLFDESGEYTLNFDTDVKLTAYIVGGGSDGKDGLYYNKTAYGGDGGMGGYINIVSDIEVNAGECEIKVIIGDRGGYRQTSVIIGNKEYCCNDAGWTVAEHGNQGICGKSVYHDAGNGVNGVETPFGWVGASGGGGAAYYSGNMTGRGRGGLAAGNGGKIVDGKSTKGEKAVGFGCGGGGGAASSTSWCKGGRGKHGCVILKIQQET